MLRLRAIAMTTALLICQPCFAQSPPGYVLVADSGDGDVTYAKPSSFVRHSKLGKRMISFKFYETYATAQSDGATRANGTYTADCKTQRLIIASTSRYARDGQLIFSRSGYNKSVNASPGTVAGNIREWACGQF
jgi:hypothetical protein